MDWDWDEAWVPGSSWAGAVVLSALVVHARQLGAKTPLKAGRRVFMTTPPPLIPLRTSDAGHGEEGGLMFTYEAAEE